MDRETAWLVVRVAHRTTGVRFGPHDPVGSRLKSHPTGHELPAGVSQLVATALGAPSDVVDRALRTTTEHGLVGVTGFLRAIGSGVDAQALERIDAMGPAVVPVHPRRLWEGVIGEVRHPSAAGNQLHRPEQGIARPVLLGIAFVATLLAMPLVYELISRAFPQWLAVGVLVLSVPALLQYLSMSVLMTVRWRRRDAFPISDPLGLRTAR